MFGSGYVVDHCMAALAEQGKEKRYKVYVTDTLQGIFELLYAYMTRKEAGIPRWIDLEEKREKPAEKPQESAEEIISRMKRKINGGE